MARRKDRFDGANAEVMVVGFEPVEKLRALKERLRSPFRFFLDRPREVYRAYGMGTSTHFRVLLHPKMLARGAVVTLQGSLWRPRPGQDRLQLGGDFLVDPEGRVVLAHPEEGPEDRVSVGEILEELEPFPLAGA